MQIFRRFSRRKDPRRNAAAGRVDSERRDAASAAAEAEEPAEDIDPRTAALSPDIPPADTPHSPLRSDLIGHEAPRDPALRGTATVARLTPSGPDLDGARVYDLLLSVELPDREPYQFLHRQLIADASLGSWKPGSQLSVRVLADNPNDLIVVG
jgi:hypothetical protein